MKPTIFIYALAASALTTAALVTGCASGSKHTESTATKEESASAAEATPSGESASGMSAEQSSQASAVSGAPMSPEQVRDSFILNQLHHIDQKEIAMAQLAQEKSQSPQVKQLAQRLMQDHQALESRVQSVAKQQNIELAGYQPATYEKAMMDQMNKLSGRQFDDMFVRSMRMSHMEVERMLEHQRRMVRNPAISSLITEALPKIRQHAQLASQTQRGLASAPESSSAPDMQNTPSSDQQMQQPQSTDQQMTPTQ